MTTITASKTLGIDLNPAFYTSPVVIGAGVTVSNPSYPYAVYRHSGATTFFVIDNNGAITSGSGIGVYLSPGGSVTNAATGSITGVTGVRISNGAATVVNDGSIAGSGGGITGGAFGVDLRSGGSVTNAATGSITGTGVTGIGVNILGGAGTVVNDGSITGRAFYGLYPGRAFGVYLHSGGSVTNAATGSIAGTGGTDGAGGVNIAGGAGTVVNDGSITGRTGVYLLSGGSVTNAASGSITGVRISNGAGTVLNNGSIASGGRYGVDLGSGGSVTNAATGSITGVNIAGGAGTVVNNGSIAGHALGVDLHSGGSVTNAATGSITDTLGAGVRVSNGAGTVVNDGSITGRTFGVYLRSGGSVTNAATGSIAGTIGAGVTGTGDGDGVRIAGGAGTVVNDGSITGVINGVDLHSGGTLTNAGSIIGNSGTAVAFGGTGSDLLVLDAGFGFSGIVAGGTSSSNTLELASTASAGTVTGLGSQFIHFGSIVFDAGAQWSISGIQRGLAGPISGFAHGDAIELTGVTATGSSYVGGILTINEAVGSATLDLPGPFTLASFNVTNNSGGTEVTVTGNDTLNGGPGNDVLNGGAGNDTLNGFAGNDILNGGAGNDTLNGGAGADVMSGGTGNDVYYVDNVNDTVTENPNEGTDTVKTTLSSYALGPNVENLTFIGTGSFAGTGNALANTITGGGGGGNDTLTGGGGNDTLIGGNGNDVLNGGASADVMLGGAGNDVYYVDNAADKVNEAAGQGTDTVYASVSYTLTAGSEIEYLRGNAGATGLTLNGNALNNTIVGGTGNDTLNGGAGNDVLNGGAGADVMAGGTGNDTYNVDNAGDVVKEAAGAGTDTVKTTLLSEILGANLENLTFIGSGNFTGTGNTLNNTIAGGAGNDTLHGGAGNDTLNGGNGNDVLVGGTGADVLTGGAGADVFRFTSLADSTVAAGGRDTIRDFASGDKIDLHLIDANSSLPGDQAFSFIGTNAFSGTAGQLRYAASGGNTLISGDVNGDKVADFSILVSGAHAFSGSDFVR